MDVHMFLTSHAAGDAKQRQHWVTRLRAAAEHHTDLMALDRGSGGTSPVGSIDSLSKSQESLK